MLHTPMVEAGRTHYCGPTAIAALTGVPIAIVEKMIRRRRKGGFRNSLGRSMPIKSTYHWELVRVLEALGCKVEQQKIFERTFGKFCEDTKHLSSAFLVRVPGHIMAVFQGVPSSSLDAVKTKRRVTNVWKVSAPTTPLYTAADLVKTERPPKPKVDIKIVRAANIQAQIKRWETKEKRAKTALKKLRAKYNYYKSTGVIK